jgi:hypothetical protein
LGKWNLGFILPLIVICPGLDFQGLVTDSDIGIAKIISTLGMIGLRHLLGTGHNIPGFCSKFFIRSQNLHQLMQKGDPSCHLIRVAGV